MRRLGDPWFNRLGLRGPVPWGNAPGGYGGAAPFSPTDIAGLVLWLAADLGLALSDGDPVVTWPDQSGNGNDVTQPVAAARPTFRTAVINGEPVVRFDGVDDVLRNLSNMGLTTICTILTVIRLDDTTEKGTMIKLGDNNDGYGYGVGAADISGNGNNMAGLFDGVRHAMPGVTWSYHLQA